jgi:N-acetylmuramoyl-L-alanine amidase
MLTVTMILQEDLMKGIIVSLLVLFAILCFPYSIYAASSGSSRTPVLVLDAGHGGSDTGAVRSGVKEKNLNLDIVKRLNTLLKGHKIKVYMTRTTDKTVDLYSRSALANRVDADLFLSIHNNAGSSRTKGTMTLYYPSDTQTARGLAGRDIASIVQKELTSRLLTTSHGLYSRPRLAVLRTTNMPAVIAEVGYMTNKAELAKLNTTSYRQKSAEALEKAVLKAFGIK